MVDPCSIERFNALGHGDFVPVYKLTDQLSGVDCVCSSFNMQSHKRDKPEPINA
jgi:hypothetical protein